MATVDQVYIEVYRFLIKLFKCEVLQGLQNNTPLPENCIVTTILDERNLDYSSNYYTDDTTQNIHNVTVKQSVECMMQLDFYGTDAQIRARHLATIWQNEISTSALQSCQPLYCKAPKQMTFVNEKNQYEPRWMVEVYLQYNPEFTHDQGFLDMPTITKIKI